MKQLVQKLLFFFARKIIDRHKPIIIGVTGSVGKTSAREAIFHVVNQKYKAYRPAKNFNDELGLPLAIIRYEDNPQKRLWAWLMVFVQGIATAFFSTKYPDVLVLEYGVDKPGDMDYLISIARPSIGVITSVGSSHYEFFKSAAAIAHEKGKLAEALPQSGTLVLNADNEHALAQQRKTQARVLTYGVNDQAQVRVIKAEERLNGQGITDLEVQTLSRHLTATVHGLGKPHASAALAAIAVAEVLGMESDLIARGIAEYRPAPGRLNVIPGLKHSVIIDDSYNASDPMVVKEALHLFSRLPASYKIAVLGDMRELGELSDQAHRDIGVLVASLDMHRLFTVGEGGKKIAAAAIESGFPKNKVSSWDNSEAAKKVVLHALEPESLILVKGSQFVRMEKITKELMAEPMRAHELLCRQYGKWLEE